MQILDAKNHKKKIDLFHNCEWVIQKQFLIVAHLRKILVS
jgi:hypothetical protein